MSLLQIIFEVVAPGAMVYIRRAAGAFRSIIQNPVGFVRNLVRAGIQGFRQFAGNFLTHLRTSLIQWLTGTLSGAGIYIPQAFTLMEIIKFVLSVLGLTWQNIRAKLVRRIGETAVRALEAGFEIVVTLVRQGPAAAWQKIQEGISNLRAMVIEQVMTFVRDRIVQAAITRLLTSLNPAGAFIQAIIAIYNTIMFFFERLRQIMQVATAFIDSIAAIAAGSIGAAANRVEQTMAGLLTLVISFLARLVGLGRVSDAVVNIVNRIRAPIDRALDRVVDWIVTMAQRAGRLITGRGTAARGPDARTPEEKNRDLHAAVEQASTIARDRTKGRRARVREINRIKEQYRMTSLEMITDSHARARDNIHVHGVINPTYDGAGFIIDAFPPEPKVVIQTEIGAPQPRAGFERVLQPPGAAGLPGFQRAHLVGAGFGAESPLGIFYTPAQVNLRLQNSGIEEFIRQIYANRAPGARFFLRAAAEPHPGTQILARVVYTLSGQLPGEPVTDIFEVRIVVKSASLTPRIVTQTGDVDEEVFGRYTSFVNSRLATL
jgi:dolichol kinase